jgi:hypothetical protein
MLALHTRNARQVDDSKARTDLTWHTTIKDEVWTLAGTAAFCRQWLLKHDLQLKVLVDKKDYGLQQLRKGLLVSNILHSINELV